MHTTNSTKSPSVTTPSCNFLDQFLRVSNIADVVIGGVVSDITILAANIQSLDEWVFDITSQTITESVGVAVTQNEWTLTITSQVIAATA